MVEGGAGQGEVLRGLQVGAGSDEGVVAGAPVTQCDAEGICGHDFESSWLPRGTGRRAVNAEPVLTV